MNVLIVYYFHLGHIYRMAEAVQEGAGSVNGADVRIRRVRKPSRKGSCKRWARWKRRNPWRVPISEMEELAAADAIIFGAPTRFGNMCGQMRQFLDATGGLWAKGALVGKLGSVFTSSGTQHGGQE